MKILILISSLIFCFNIYAMDHEVESLLYKTDFNSTDSVNLATDVLRRRGYSERSIQILIEGLQARSRQPSLDPYGSKINNSGTSYRFDSRSGAFGERGLPGQGVVYPDKYNRVRNYMGDDVDVSDTNPNEVRSRRTRIDISQENIIPGEVDKKLRDIRAWIKSNYKYEGDSVYNNGEIVVRSKVLEDCIFKFASESLCSNAILKQENSEENILSENARIERKENAKKACEGFKTNPAKYIKDQDTIYIQTVKDYLAAGAKFDDEVRSGAFQQNSSLCNGKIAELKAKYKALAKVQRNFELRCDVDTIFDVGQRMIQLEVDNKLDSSQYRGYLSGLKSFIVKEKTETLNSQKLKDLLSNITESQSSENCRGQIGLLSFEDSKSGLMLYDQSTFKKNQGCLETKKMSDLFNNRTVCSRFGDIDGATVKKSAFFPNGATLNTFKRTRFRDCSVETETFREILGGEPMKFGVAKRTSILLNGEGGVEDINQFMQYDRPRKDGLKTAADKGAKELDSNVLTCNSYNMPGDFERNNIIEGEAEGVDN